MNIYLLLLVETTDWNTINAGNLENFMKWTYHETEYFCPLPENSTCLFLLWYSRCRRVKFWSFYLKEQGITVTGKSQEGNNASTGQQQISSQLILDNDSSEIPWWRVYHFSSQPSAWDYRRFWCIIHIIYHTVHKHWYTGHIYAHILCI